MINTFFFVKLIGAFSDKCTSRFGKRRPFIVVSGILTCLSMVGVAYAKEFGAWIARHYYSPDVFDSTVKLNTQQTFFVCIIYLLFSFCLGTFLCNCSSRFFILLS